MSLKSYLRSHCESYRILLKAGDVDIANVLSLGGLFVPSNSLADLLCYSGFRSSATFASAVMDQNLILSVSVI